MKLKSGQRLIVAVNLIALAIFTAIFLIRKNYEFMIYIGVIVFFMAIILASNHRVNFPNDVLWGLTMWAFLHMAGGGLVIGGTRMYDFMILDIIGDPYNILRYDQLVHAIGFAVATVVSYHLIRGQLKKNHAWPAVCIIVTMAGVGFGALNEVIEFFATILLGSTGVGGYENTALDLVFNLIGAVGAMVFIWKREKGKK